MVARAQTDGDGRAEVPLGTAAVTAAAPPYAPARERVRDGAAEVALYDPRLQSPEYGGGTSRDRYVPAVKVPPPAGRPAWTFESRTLLEFPPAVSDGLAVVGTNSGRVYALDADDGSLAWARRQRGEIASSPAIAGGSVFVGSMGGQLVAYGTGAGTPLWTFESGSPIESSPLVVDGLVYVGTWAGVPPRRGRRDRPGALALPGAGRHQGQRRPGGRADRGGRLLGQRARPRPAARATSAGPTPAARASTAGRP